MIRGRTVDVLVVGCTPLQHAWIYRKKEKTSKTLANLFNLSDSNGKSLVCYLLHNFITLFQKFKSNPATKQIELDLLRTLPNNKHYDTIESPGVSIHFMKQLHTIDDGGM